MDDRLRDMILTKLSPVILSVVCPPPGATPKEYPDRLFNYDRDLCYLETSLCPREEFKTGTPHLSEDRHIDRCISMILGYCNSESHTGHAFYIAGIFLRITPEHQSVTSLDSVTEQQWWDVMRSLLPVLVDSTKKYMQISSKSDLEKLIRCVDEFLERLEENMQWNRRWQEMGLEMGPEMQSLEQMEGVAIAVKELRTAASNMLESFGQLSVP
ncbi:hypothetical protein BD769DRAFT_1504076 [Suillus cothurnatus]|nr:hypothetical protein BD769DRAFT_1504076 [Suillus cothurnatus]